jgi:hypothetical protein
MSTDNTNAITIGLCTADSGKVGKAFSGIHLVKSQNSRKNL